MGSDWKWSSSLAEGDSPSSYICFNFLRSCFLYVRGEGIFLFFVCSCQSQWTGAFGSGDLLRYRSTLIFSFNFAASCLRYVRGEGRRDSPKSWYSQTWLLLRFFTFGFAILCSSEGSEVCHGFLTGFASWRARRACGTCGTCFLCLSSDDEEDELDEELSLFLNGLGFTAVCGRC